LGRQPEPTQKPTAANKTDEQKPLAFLQLLQSAARHKDTPGMTIV
jgi:hypothetical protein